MNSTSKPSRRMFLAGAAAASYSRVLGANDRIGMGFIGVGNRGDQVHDAFLEHGDAETRAVCDLRDDYMDFAVKKSRATPKKYDDYKKLLEDKSVDAVVIATPDHWHALMMIEACRAGKDVYVEKPMSLTVWEGRRMVDVANETKRVVQVGIHRRSAKFLQEAAKIVQDGAIGHVTAARAFHVQNEWPLGLGQSDARTLDDRKFDQWLGPAPKVPYNKNRTFYNFRWFYEYSGGQLTNFGVHYMDMMRWAMGKDWPKAVTAIGGRYAGIKDNREIPDTMEVIWDYGDSMMTFTQINANGTSWGYNNPEMEIRGNKGTMYLYGNRWDIVPDKIASVPFGSRTPVDRNIEKSWSPSRKAEIEPKTMQGSADTAFHARNFLDCVKSRGKCNCDPLTGHISTSSTIIGNIAYKQKAQLEWDGKGEKFTNHPEANKMLRYDYRAPYKLS